MKMKKLLLALLLTTQAFAQNAASVLTGSAQPPLPFNIITQPGFENRTTGWSVTGGVFTTATATADVARGRFSGKWTPPISTVAGVLLQSDAVTVPPGLFARDCRAEILYRGLAATNGTLNFEVYDGTNILGAVAMGDVTTYTSIQTTTFTCPSSGTLRIRVRNTATTPSSTTALYFDEATIADANSVGIGGGVNAMAAVGSAPNANGASISATTLTLQPASGSFPGVVSSGAQTFSGSKTITGSFTGTLTGNASTATAFAADPTDCAANNFATGIDASGNLTCAIPGGVVPGTVTSVGFTVPGSSILAISGSPITTSGTLGLTTTGTSGGIPYFSSSSQLSTSAALAANQIVIGGGAGVAPATIGSVGTLTTILHGNASGVPSYSKLVDGDVDVAAGISWSKTQGLGTQKILIGSAGGVPVEQTLTGDVALVNPAGANAIQTNVVSNTKLAQMVAHTYKGNNTGSTANAADITSTQLTADLNAFSSTLQGMATASGGGTANFLRADGTWAAPGVPALTSAHIFVGNGSNVATDVAVSGDVTITSAGSVAIGASKVTNGMLAGSIDMATKMTGTLQAAQFPTLTGDVTTTGGALATTLAATSNGTLATLSKSTGVAIHGSNTNDSGGAGNYGEYSEVSVGSTSVPTSGNYGDLTSLSLTAGDWEVTGRIEWSQNSATMTSQEGGLSTTSGNNSTGLTEGLNDFVSSYVTGKGQTTIPGYRFSLSTTTTVYLKFLTNYSVGTPKAFGSLSARRMR